MISPKSNDDIWIDNLTSNLSEKIISKSPSGSNMYRSKGNSLDDSAENGLALLAKETLDDLDWCLNQLSTIKTRMSVANMARNKFKSMINEQLNISNEERGVGHDDEGKKTNKQTQDFILNTFLDRETHLQKIITTPSSAPVLHSCSLESFHTDSSMPNSCNNGYSMCSYSKDKIPRYGVECANEEDLMNSLHKMNDWSFDIFHLDAITSQQPLATIVYNVFLERDLFTSFKIPKKTCLIFLVALENSYLTDVPFHNSKHAADVTQTIQVLLNMNSFHEVFTPLEILSALFAAAVHDAGHPGVTNQFLVNTSSDLALLYNDESVLENYHVSTAFKILQNEKCNMLINFSKEQRINFRKIVIDLVLATDMSKHMTLLADMKTMLETNHFTSTGDLKLDDYSDKMLVLQTMVHCADLSNPAKPLPLYIKWVDLVMEEFFQQGDRERKLDMEISPMCDRSNSAIEKTQVGFIDFVIRPLWETFADLVNPDAQEILETLEGNKQYYQAKIGALRSRTTSTKKDQFMEEEEDESK